PWLNTSARSPRMRVTTSSPGGPASAISSPHPASHSGQVRKAVRVAVVVILVPLRSPGPIVPPGPAPRRRRRRPPARSGAPERPDGAASQLRTQQVGPVDGDRPLGPVALDDELVEHHPLGEGEPRGQLVGQRGAEE